MNYRFFVLLTSLLTTFGAYAQDKHERIGEGLNSPANESSVILSPDGQILYFVRQYHPQNVGGVSDPGDIWYSEQQEDGSWGAARHGGNTINNSNYNAIIGFAGSESAYVHGHYVDGKKPTTQGISRTQGRAGQWSSPAPVKIPYYYTKSNHRSGSLHAGQNVMIVTLQSYDSRGAEDLYVMFRQSDDSWSEPKNLGNDINTPYQEMTPFLAPDGKTLFFASNGYEGFGSRDIFMSVRLDDSWRRWSNPKNLGSSVNTPGTELYYRIPQNSDYAYLTSTQNSDGLADIVRVRISPEEEEVLAEADSTLVVPEEPPVVADSQPQLEATTTPEVSETEETPEMDEPTEPMVTIRGAIASRSDQQPLAAAVAFRSMKNDTTWVETVSTDSLGEFSISLPQNDNYGMLVQADGFIRERDKLLLSEANTAAADDIVRNYQLTPIEVGVTVNLENVLFDRGTSTMLPGSEERLNEVVAFLDENPNVAIEVGGHTDNQGRADLNLALSRERAEAVREYLLQQGGDESRITAQGYGGTRPISSNAIEEERQKNRRVEFTIVKK